MAEIHTRGEALALAQHIIENCKRWDARQLQYLRGYFNGLTGAWWCTGLISEEEMVHVREALEVALDKAERDQSTPPWWDIASRLGSRLWLIAKESKKGRSARIAEYVNSGWHRGIYKRIDENRELLELLQHEAPDLLERCPWVEGWLDTQDEFLSELAVLTNAPNPHAALGTTYLRSWPGKKRDAVQGGRNG